MEIISKYFLMDRYKKAIEKINQDKNIYYADETFLPRAYAVFETEKGNVRFSYYNANYSISSLPADEISVWVNPRMFGYHIRLSDGKVLFPQDLSAEDRLLLEGAIAHTIYSYAYSPLHVCTFVGKRIQQVTLGKVVSDDLGEPISKRA